MRGEGRCGFGEKTRWVVNDDEPYLVVWLFGCLVWLRRARSGAMVHDAFPPFPTQKKKEKKYGSTFAPALTSSHQARILVIHVQGHCAAELPSSYAQRVFPMESLTSKNARLDTTCRINERKMSMGECTAKRIKGASGSIGHPNPGQIIQQSSPFAYAIF